MRSGPVRNRPAMRTVVPTLVAAVLGLLSSLPAVVVPGQEIDLDPSAGPPGTSVTASVDGFDCSIGVVELLWGESGVVGTVDLDGGADQTTFPVPAEAEPGGHEVFARCEGSDDVAAETAFEVEQVADLVTVPDLVGRPLDEAETLLAERGLVLGEVAGEGDAVADQDPGPGTGVDVESEVAVTLAAVVPPPGNTGTDDPAERFPLLWIALAGLLFAGAAAGVPRLRRARRRRDRRWVSEHVRVRPAPTSPPTVTLAADPTDPAGPGATLVIRLVASADDVDQHLEVIGR
ncbi:PASTA domain-containing protein [Isoptericola sediminis]|uniref:PASTA domain-containing protein n=1 Tax=Isoptericola sediminis TaxID=2733572 RepID=A0A849JUU7_9MICO|nr:PASTA domain-containing protein [Isoptericola sediminis]